MSNQDTILLLGKLVEPEQGRDAIHIAVTPVISASDLALAPAQGLVLATADDPEQVIAARDAKPIGIVDPFLDGYVLKGQRFWMFLMPATITSLRHVWTHPAFPPEGQIADADADRSEDWLREFIDTHDAPSYRTLIAAALSNDNDDFLFIGGEDARGEIPSEVWHHIEVVTGQKIKHRPSHFSCSC